MQRITYLISNIEISQLQAIPSVHDSDLHEEPLPAPGSAAYELPINRGNERGRFVRASRVEEGERSGDWVGGART